MSTPELPLNHTAQTYAYLVEAERVLTKTKLFLSEQDSRLCKAVRILNQVRRECQFTGSMTLDNPPRFIGCEVYRAGRLDKRCTACEAEFFMRELETSP